MSKPSIVLSAVLVAALAVPLAAHFAVARSSPAADQVLAASPKRLQLWFSQVPAAGVSELKLLKVAGDERADVVIGKSVIDKDTKSMHADLPKPLDAGAYVIAWRGAGDDGHAQKGEIKFTVAPKKTN